MEKIKYTFSFTAKTEPRCVDFLKIKYNDIFVSIKEFAEKNTDINNEQLLDSIINYRGVEKKYREFINDNNIFSKSLDFVNLPFNSNEINYSPSRFYANEVCNYLQKARLFTIKCHCILECDIAVHWHDDYLYYYYMRCLYFSDACMWYSNTFDQILQYVFWEYKLYKNMKNKHNKRYNSSWSIEKVLALCNYNSVTNQLHNMKIKDIKDIISECYNKICNVRNWTNFIKHKGGINYQFLEPLEPFDIYICPKEEFNSNENFMKEEYGIKPFQSPIDVDIDKAVEVLKFSHIALCDCINELLIIEDRRTKNGKNENAFT